MEDSTDDNYCRYYDKNDTYAVMFTNKKSLAIDVVETLFSKYGVIKEVHQAGSATGICIVKFEEKSSAIKCIEDVHGRWPIALRKFTPWHVKKAEEERRGNRSKDKKNGLGKNTTWGSARLEAARNYMRGIRRSDDAAKNVDSQLSNSTMKEHSSVENVASSSCRPVESPISHENDHKHEDIGRNCNVLKESSIITSDNSNDDNLKASVTPVGQEQMSQAHDPVPEKSLQSIKIPKRPPKLVLRKPKSFHDNVFYSISQGRVSPVALKKPWQSEPAEHVIAQEVIVGNIDLKCDVQSILDLFKEQEPLLVSSMKLDEKNSFQYCHVYFKTKWQATAVESRWDNAEVCGRRIIVLRAETLAELIR